MVKLVSQERVQTAERREKMRLCLNRLKRPSRLSKLPFRSGFLKGVRLSKCPRSHGKEVWRWSKLPPRSGFLQGVRWSSISMSLSRWTNMSFRNGLPRGCLNRARFSKYRDCKPRPAFAAYSGGASRCLCRGGQECPSGAAF